MGAQRYSKAIFIAILVGILAFGLNLIESSIYEREKYQQQALDDVANSWTGSQRLILPVVVVSITRVTTEQAIEPHTDKKIMRKVERQAQHYLPLESLISEVKLKSTTLRRGLFTVPVYESTVVLRGDFSLAGLNQVKSLPGFSHINAVYLALGVSDRRGLLVSPEIRLNGKQANAIPGSGIAFATDGFRANLDSHQKEQRFSIQFSLRGMFEFSFLPTAEITTVSLESDWLHPSFVGRFLPSKREVTERGYKASWITGKFSSSIGSALERCRVNHCNEFKNLWFGVKQIETVNHYVKSARSIKYALLVIIITFASFLLIEVLSANNLNAIHYFFVGAALTIFYLLLLALSEHVGFLWAYVAASLACSLLIYFYIKAQVGVGPSVVLLAVLIGLYAIHYLIINSEDYAYLAGALLCFSVLSLVMLLTRKVEWPNWLPSIK